MFFVLVICGSAALFAQTYLVFGEGAESVPVESGAAETVPPATGGAESVPLENPAKYKDVCELVGAILTIIAELAAVVGVIFIIWSGFLFVMAQGNVTKIEAAKRTFYTTIIGMAIILGASVITRIIFKTVQSVTAADGGVSICNVK